MKGRAADVAERTGRRSMGAVKGRGWLVIACLALVGVMMLAAFPARTFAQQRRQRDAAASQVRSLSSENRALEERARVLQTEAEIERLAREQYGLVRPGEEVYSVVGPPASVPQESPPPPPPAPKKRWWDRALDAVTSVF